MAAITVTDLTQGQLTGTGVFDELMRANKAHLADEYSKGHIKGSEYATVYLGALQSVMSQSLQFLLQQQQVDLQAQLIEKQIESEGLNQLQIAEQTQNLIATRDQIVAQTTLAEQQARNLIAEALNIPKQGVVLDAQAAVQTQQKLNLVTEGLRTEAQTTQVEAETLNIPKQGDLIDAQVDVQEQQKINMLADKLATEAQTSLTNQQFSNAIIEGTVLLAQECKLSAEFNLIQEQTLKTITETGLLAQKKVTEQAQTSGAGVSPESVIGRQSALYEAQQKGFIRDSEQKAAKLMVDTWNVRKTMDDSTPVNGQNKLGDIYIGQAVEAMLEGIGVIV